MSEPFCRTPVALLDDTRLDPYDTRVYESLWRRSDYRTHRTRPGTNISTIVSIAHVSRPTVIASLRRLAETGWIVVEKGRHNEAPTYVLQSTSFTTQQSTPLPAVKLVDVNVVDHKQSAPLTAAVNGIDHPVASEPSAGKALAEPFRTTTESTSERITRTPRTTSGPPAGAVREVWEYYLEHVQPAAKLMPDEQIRRCLKHFSLDDVKQAIDHFANDWWWMGEGPPENPGCGPKGGGWFFTAKHIDQFLSMRPRGRTPPQHNGTAKNYGYANGRPKVLAPTQPGHDGIRAGIAATGARVISDETLRTDPALQKRLGVIE